MFDISQVSDYISVAALIGALCVGYIVKNAVPNDGVNRFIPLIAALVGVVVCVATDAATGTLGVMTVVTGMVSGLASTGLYEAFNNLIGVSNED